MTAFNIQAATTAMLVEFYNSYNADGQIKKFSDRKTAERRCQAIVDAQARAAERAAAEAAAREAAEAEALAAQVKAQAATPKPGAAGRAAAQAARDAIRAARYPSATTTTVTKAGATVTRRPADSAEIRATVTGTAVAVKTPAKPASAPSKLDAQRVRLTVRLANPKAGKRGFFAEAFLPAVIDAQDAHLTVVAADVFVRFPGKTRAQLADAWAYLTQEGFAERI